MRIYNKIHFEIELANRLYDFEFSEENTNNAKKLEKIQKLSAN
jgi:hypothetical protein